MAKPFWRFLSATATSQYDAFAPNSASLLVSDSPGVAERSATTLRFERPIVEGNGYRHAAPGARVSFITNASRLRLSLYWNAQITRLDTFESTFAVLVDGTLWTSFDAPFAASVAGAQNPVVTLIPGTKTVTLVWPYAAGVELRGVEVSAGATMIAPTRPTDTLAMCGDSITHGFFATQTVNTWAFKLAGLKSRQLKNFANGSEQAVAANATTALTGSAADRVTYLIGYNNFVAQTALVTFQAAVEGWITNARAALPSAKIYIISPIYSPNTDTITLADYRSAVQSAETAAGDSETFFVDGLSIMTNSNDRLLDGIHPNNVGSAEIATALASIITS